MAYSKILKQSNYFICRSLKSLKLSYKNDISHVLNTQNKVSWGANIYLNNCHYSTIFDSKFSDHPRPNISKCASPLNFSAFLSTNGSGETYKIVITNPSEGTSTTLDSSLNSASAIKNVDEILPASSSSEVTDIATSLTGELSNVADVIEPSLASLGLCNWTPVGLIQMLLEQMHSVMHWPWWISIVATTIIARILCFPILLKTQKNAINMSNYMPQLQYLQMKFGQARRSGNSLDASKYANEMLNFTKENNITPLKNAIFPMLQAPVFLSFFFALRAMAKVPVESMKHGGILWVTDLTIPDPYYILPVIACGTLYIVLKIGAESGVRTENLKLAKYFLNVAPLLVFPFCINFPSAVLYYWVTNNFFTLITVSVLKIKPVKEYFNLPSQKPIDKKFQPPKKGFLKSIKDSYEDQKVLGNLQERRRIDEIRFQKAATGPIPRTYPYDPTKPRASNVASAIAAKERKS